MYLIDSYFGILSDISAVFFIYCARNVLLVPYSSRLHLFASCACLSVWQVSFLFTVKG